MKASTRLGWILLAAVALTAGWGFGQVFFNNKVRIVCRAPQGNKIGVFEVNYRTRGDLTKNEMQVACEVATDLWLRRNP